MLKRIFIILAIIAVTVGYAVYQKKSLETQLEGEAGSEAILSVLPEASFSTLEGAEYDLNSVKPYELLVVHFWGTWCAPCEAELPELLTLIKRYQGKQTVKFLLVAVNDEVVKVKKHLKGLKMPEAAELLWLIDNKNVHRDVFGTTRVPETFVFSSDKRTLRKYVGPQEWSKPAFFQTFDEFLQMSSRKL